MEFFTVSNYKRPIRLSDSTRQFAWDSLHYLYGKDTDSHPGITMDDIANFESLSSLDQYDLVIRRIAQESPLRICTNEKISGAATYGLAISEKIPATYKGEVLWPSVSHLTVDFETVIKRGINGVEEDVDASISKHNEEDKLRFLRSCKESIKSFKIWHQRYLDALKDRPEYINNYNNLINVPFKPAANFYEAVQSLWFTFAFLRLCGNWPGFGRLDYMLGDYLKKDLKDGTLTLDEAREILAHFWIKGCEWVRGGDYIFNGDAQHYQNVVLAGIDGNGNDVTNEVTYLILDIVEELGISDFPITIRLNRNSDEKLLRRAIEVLKFGGGIIAFYNEETIIKAHEQYGYPKEEAWKFANDGCWETMIPGKTFFQYRPIDILQVLQLDTMQSYDENVSFDSYEDLYKQYVIDMYAKIKENFVSITSTRGEYEVAPGVIRWKPQRPCTVISLFEEGCIIKGQSYLEGGPIYNIYSPHMGGLPDVANSLYAIKKIVFEEKKCSFKEFVSILKNNWEGHEDLRLYAKNHYSYYGNGNDEVDEIAAQVLSDFAAGCDAIDGIGGLRIPAGASSFGRQIEWSNKRLAAPFGCRRGDVLAPNNSPTPSTDKEGATAIIRSYCKADLSKMVTGAALDLKLLKSNVEGEDGTKALMSLLRGFVLLGGLFFQPDVEDKEILKQAQKHPDDYQTLSVRVSGWNARFVTLSKEWQDMVIDETK